MRNVILLLWILLGLAYWYLSKNCCTIPNAKEVSEARTVAPVTKVPVKKLTPLAFACSDDKPTVEERWTRFRDSLVSNLKDDQILEVRGLQYEDETNSTKSTSLGLARAAQVKKLFSIDDERINVTSGVKGNNCTKEEMNNLVAFRYLRNSAKIKEVDDKTLIYFPYNSTNKLADAEVESYLKDVAKRVIRTKETVRLVGHTDDDGSAASNMALGQRRADIIERYLLDQGVPSSQLSALSKGELDPVADNGTKAGMAKNRRTELQIIK